MTSPDNVTPPLDYTALAFPSDRLTVADLRRVHPGRFDSDAGARFQRIEADPTFALDGLLRLERLLARAAFSRACGRSVDVLEEADMTRQDCIDDLTQCYKTYRLADGPTTTEQLVRGIEAQAAAQASRGR